MGQHNQKMPFLILAYFFTTFIIIRALVYSWENGLIPELSLYIREIEIHHFNFGIFILVIVGYLLLINKNEENRFKLAKLYGIGLALAFDEFGMWLHLENNYWRQSYDGIIIITVILLNIIYLNHIWQKIINQNIIWTKRILGRFGRDMKLKKIPNTNKTNIDKK